MKFSLLFIGTVCLFGGNHAQISTVATTLATALSASNANLNATITRVNNTIVAADQTILISFNQLFQSLITLYNSYMTKFQAYTTIDLSMVTNAIGNIQGIQANTPSRMHEDSWNVQQIFTDAQASSQQVQSALNAAIANMTSACGSTCTSARAINCAKKYAAQLTTAPLSLNRVTGCVASEESRYTSIAETISSLYASSLTMATNYLLVGKVCDTPAASVLNNATSGNMPPSTQCFTTYLQRFSNIPWYGYYSADTNRYSQVSLVGFRAKRCSKLVALDIQDRTSQIVAKFNSCLITGA